MFKYKSNHIACLKNPITVPMGFRMKSKFLKTYLVPDYLFVLIVMKFIEHKVYHFNNSFKMYNSVSFSPFIVLCNQHHYIIPEHFHHPKQKPLTHLGSHSPFPSPPPAPGSHSFAFCLYEFAYSRHFPYKRNNNTWPFVTSLFHL